MTTRTPSPPKWLSPYAQEEWKRVAGGLFKRGVLTDETQGLLAAYASAIGTVREAEILLTREGLTTSSKSGGCRAHPAVSAKNVSANVALQLAKRLGLFDDTTPEGSDDYADLGVR